MRSSLVVGMLALMAGSAGNALAAPVDTAGMFRATAEGSELIKTVGTSGAAKLIAGTMMGGRAQVGTSATMALGCLASGGVAVTIGTIGTAAIPVIGITSGYHDHHNGDHHNGHHEHHGDHHNGDHEHQTAITTGVITTTAITTGITNITTAITRASRTSQRRSPRASRSPQRRRSQRRWT